MENFSIRTLQEQLNYLAFILETVAPAPLTLQHIKAKKDQWGECAIIICKALPDIDTENEGSLLP